jgi:hypothetical protein
VPSETQVVVKRLLMRRYGIAEPVAHKVIQQVAMHLRLPAEQAAALLGRGVITGPKSPLTARVASGVEVSGGVRG